MQRTDGFNNDPSAFGPGKPGYRLVAPYTVLTPTAQNAITEEISRAIEGFGITLNPAAYDQLFNVIKFSNRIGITEPSSSQTIIGTESKPGDHPSSPSNVWKPFFVLKCGDDTWVRFFWGNGSGGIWAITWNASWNPASGGQNWSKDVTGTISRLLLCTNTGELQWAGRAAGAGTWTDWHASPLGDVRIDGALNVPSVTASDLHATDDLQVDDDATISGDLNVAGNIVLTGLSGDIAYDPGAVKIRTTPIPLGDFGGGGYRNGGNGQIEPTTPGNFLVWPVRVPTGTVLNIVEMIVTQGGSTATKLRALRKHSADWNVPTPPTVQVKITDNGSSGSGNKLLQVDFGGITTVVGEEYEIEWETKQSGDAARAIRIVAWADPGPRNY